MKTQSSLKTFPASSLNASGRISFTHASYLGQNLRWKDFIGAAGCEVQKGHQFRFYEGFHYGKGLVHEPCGMNNINFLEPHWMSFLKRVKTKEAKRKRKIKIQILSGMEVGER